MKMTMMTKTATMTMNNNDVDDDEHNDGDGCSTEKEFWSDKVDASMSLDSDGKWRKLIDLIDDGFATV